MFRFVPASALALRPDASGSRYWSVSLDRTMLSYFDVPPHTRFATHRHEAEQITHVLEGALFFELGGEVVRVGAGDAIAVRSNALHAVFTEEEGARAFDAWSPVPSQYEGGSLRSGTWQPHPSRASERAVGDDTRIRSRGAHEGRACGARAAPREARNGIHRTKDGRRRSGP